MNILIEPSDQIDLSSIHDEARNFLRLFNARASDLFTLSPMFISMMGSSDRLTRNEISAKREKAAKRLPKLNKRLNRVSVFEQKVKASRHYKSVCEEVLTRVNSYAGIGEVKNPLFGDIDYKHIALLAVIAELVLDLSDSIGPFAEEIGEMRRISTSKKSVALAQRLVQSLSQDGIELPNVADKTLNDLAGGQLQTNTFTPVRGPEFEVKIRLLIRSVTIKSRRFFHFNGPKNRFPWQAISCLIGMFLHGVQANQRSIERTQAHFPSRPGRELDQKQRAVHENKMPLTSKGEDAKRKADWAIWEAKYERTKHWVGFGQALQEMFADEDMWPHIKHIPINPVDIISGFGEELTNIFYDPDLFPYPPYE